MTVAFFAFFISINGGEVRWGCGDFNMSLHSDCSLHRNLASVLVCLGDDGVNLLVRLAQGRVCLGDTRLRLALIIERRAQSLEPLITKNIPNFSHFEKGVSEKHDKTTNMVKLISSYKNIENRRKSRVSKFDLSGDSNARVSQEQI